MSAPRSKQLSLTVSLGLILSACGGGGGGGGSGDDGASDPTVSDPNRLDFAQSGCCVNSITHGDFDGDGNTDLAIARTPNDLNHAATVFFGEGAGSFSESKDIETAGQKIMTSGDRDMDGNDDLVLVGSLQPNFTTLLGNADQSFSSTDYSGPTVSFSDGRKAAYIEDVNQDGNRDVIHANFTTYLGNGSGGLQTPALEADLPDDVSSDDFLAVGQFSGSGPLDIVVATESAQVGRPIVIASMRLESDGSLVLVDSYTESDVPTGPKQLRSSDLNNDGMPDLVALFQNANEVATFVNQGGGQFSIKDRTPVGSSATDIVVEDLDDDGSPDIATADRGSDSVTVLTGNGDGTFDSLKPVEAPDNPVSLTPIDLDGNGKKGLAVLKESGGAFDTTGYVQLISNVTE